MKTFNFKASALLFFLLILSFLTGYLVLMVERALNHPISYDEHLPDAFMEEVVAKRMDINGHLESELKSPKLVHYSKDDRLTIKTPQIQVYRPSSPPWQISAHYAESYDEFQLVYLWEHVRIHEAAGPNNYETTLLTEALTLYPNRRFAETDRDVIMKQPGSEVQATGMQLSLPEGWVKLLSQARGFYDPESYQKK